MTTKVHHLNSHLEKFRKEKKITITLEGVESLSHYSHFWEIDKKVHKLFITSFKNKEDYKTLLSKLPKDMDRAGLYYLVTVYWIAYVCFYHNDKFEKAMGECLESIDENIVLLDSPRFCKKAFYYLNPIGSIK